MLIDSKKNPEVLTNPPRDPGHSVVIAVSFAIAVVVSVAFALIGV